MALRNPSCVRQAGAVIRFRIDSADVYARTAYVAIEARPCGSRKVPDEDDYGGVTVHDALDCLLNEDEEDLVDRMGYAAYMRPANDANADCRWEIISLCCP